MKEGEVTGAVGVFLCGAAPLGPPSVSLSSSEQAVS